MGYIYKITNKINGKSYIGQTITPIRVRMYKHYSQSKIATTGVDYAIQKYGRENFTVEQICKCDYFKKITVRPFVKGIFKVILYQFFYISVI